MEGDGPLVPGPEHSLALSREVRRELDGEVGRGVDGAQAVVGSAGEPSAVTGARLTDTEHSQD